MSNVLAMDITTEIAEWGARWTDAEERGDTAALDALTTDDFTLVGPVGFVLTKEQWLDRYRIGAFRTDSLSWDEVAVRDYGDAAVAVGKQTQRAEYQGTRADGEFRTTHMFVRGADGTWRMAGLHIGMLGGPPPFPAGGAPGSAPGRPPAR
jgi:ketosteroid isomerase-like protein